VEELRKAQTAAAISATPLVTPATPPAETDEEIDATQDTPVATVSISPPLPPVTPSKHVTTAAVKAKSIAPPGQPRKTPQAKRVAVDSDQEEDDDVLPALGVIPNNRPKVKSMKLAGKVTSSEARPTRVTRSTASAATVRKTGTAASPIKSSGQGPHKIPRLATTRTTAAAKAVVAALPQVRQPAPPPTPSRLPTLISSKRLHQHSNSLTDSVASATLKPPKIASDAWMKANVSAVVVPKSGRPGLRSVRRRRSSFSSADVVA
jgi:cell division cycle 14